MCPIVLSLNCSSTALNGGLTFRDKLLAMQTGPLRVFQLNLPPYPLQRQSSETAPFPQTAPSWTTNGGRATNVFQETAAKRSRLGKYFGVESTMAPNGSAKSANGIVLQTVPTRTGAHFTISTAFTMSR